MLTSFIWSMKMLALVSMFGNLFIFVGLLSILLFIFLYADFADLSQLYVGHLSNLPIFFGMVIYALEGIGKQFDRPVREKVTVHELKAYSILTR